MCGILSRTVCYKESPTTDESADSSDRFLPRAGESFARPVVVADSRAACGRVGEAIASGGNAHGWRRALGCALRPLRRMVVRRDVLERKPEVNARRCVSRARRK